MDNQYDEFFPDEEIVTFQHEIDFEKRVNRRRKNAAYSKHYRRIAKFPHGYPPGYWFDNKRNRPRYIGNSKYYQYLKRSSSKKFRRVSKIDDAEDFARYSRGHYKKAFDLWWLYI